jgi:hypothetical protein
LDEIFRNLIDHHRLQRLRAQAVRDLMVDHLVSHNHARDNISAQAFLVEKVCRIVTAKRRLASKGKFLVWHEEDMNILDISGRKRDCTSRVVRGNLVVNHFCGRHGFSFASIQIGFSRLAGARVAARE